MHNKQESLYWALLYHFLSTHNYEMIYYSETDGEVWLEVNDWKNSTLIRLKRQDIDWSNWLRNDVVRVQEITKQLIKRKLRKQQKVINIYISKLDPIDDWRDMIESLTDRIEKSIQVDTVLFTEENGKEQRKFLEETFEMKYENFISIAALQEQEPELVRLQVAQLIQMKKQQQQHILNYAKPIFTILFLAIQIAMFALLEIYGKSTNTVNLIKFGAKYNPFIVQGEWWRFFTPIFLHIGFLHLAMNSVALYFIGSQVEKIVGNLRFLFVYLFAGFLGSVASFVFSDNVSAGASGAIFGCFGALLYIGLTYSKLFSKTMIQSTLTLIGVNLVFGLVTPGIDNAGHIGGLIGGFLAAAIVHVPKRKLSVTKRAGAILLSLILTIGALMYGYTIHKNETDTLYSLYEVQQALNAKHDEKAKKLLKEIVSNENPPLEARFLLGYIYAKQGDTVEARKQLEMVIQQNRHDDRALYFLAIVSGHENKIDEALQYINEAIKINPENNDYKKLKDELTRIINSNL
ncbi:rhomboid family intramembrane serine protease [Bacillus sp. 165]|uniref:rhomboid family intramembrane serine protease n=1 Tax=Bacillus sp. 165 TaxID=1529117 RepID=UPI001ADCF358|nr:rhomboid family intramembrane serine protease [Bacillus sp. 165]MBO9129637.1 rhomboid family intramembrane serine protease [Bacillus sp. 165]